jgi:hypothetical protein
VNGYKKAMLLTKVSFNLPHNQWCRFYAVADDSAKTPKPTKITNFICWWHLVEDSRPARKSNVLS